MKSEQRAILAAAMMLIADGATELRYADGTDYGTAGRRPKTNHQSESCAKCRAAIGPGRLGRMCKKCRGDS